MGENDRTAYILAGLMVLTFVGFAAGVLALVFADFS